MRTVTKRLSMGRCALTGVLILACTILMMGAASQKAHAARISKKELILYVGDISKLRIIGTSEKVQWKSTKRKIATVDSKGKVTAKKTGKAVIMAKTDEKAYYCIVTVRRPDNAKRLQMANREAKRVVRKVISKDMNMAERAYVLFRWLSSNCSWQTHQSTAAYKKNYGNEAYAALIWRKAACSGYAKAYVLMCKLAKVPVRHINAGSRTHQWNEVKVRGRWLKVDTYGGTFESTKGIRKSLLGHETYNEKGKKEIPILSFKIKN